MTYSQSICSILQKTLNIQDTFYNFMSTYYKSLLPGKMGEDTVPFTLITSESAGDWLETIGFYYSKREQKIKNFSTMYFRIEEIHEADGCITISYLLPFDIDGNPVNTQYQLYRLERTSCCLTVPLKDICGVQFLDPRLVNRKWPIVEPKW
ncbi:CotY/CotZ family spore coat protein [Bacillus sp. AK128]